MNARCHFGRIGGVDRRTSRFALRVGLAMVVAGIAAGVVASPAAAQTFTVTSVADSGAGSLRQAITSANATPGLDTISFNLPGSGPFTIVLASPLPNLTNPAGIVIDATTQPGYAAQPLE